MNIKPRDTVEILVHGEWEGPYLVTAFEGRTTDHLVLSGPNGMFEIYNDAPFNMRKAQKEEI
jgi:hypothetical protein